MNLFKIKDSSFQFECMKIHELEERIYKRCLKYNHNNRENFKLF
jgi:hypothetical protein